MRKERMNSRLYTWGFADDGNFELSYEKKLVYSFPSYHFIPLNAFISNIILRLNNVLRIYREPTMVEYKPTLVQRITFTSGSPEWKQVACGSDFSAGLTRNGEVYTWGKSVSGYDRYHHANIQTPTKVGGLDGIFIVHISCGEWHMAALSDKGEVFIWYVSS